MGRSYTPRFIIRTTHVDGSKMELCYDKGKAAAKLHEWCEALCRVNPHVPQVVLAEVCTNDRSKTVVARWQRA